LVLIRWSGFPLLFVKGDNPNQFSFDIFFGGEPRVFLRGDAVVRRSKRFVLFFETAFLVAGLSVFISFGRR